MSDTGSSPTTTQPASAAPAGAHASVRDQAYTVPADRISALPAPAAANLTWEAGGHRIAYTARASHIPVRSDYGDLLGEMFSLAYTASALDDAPAPAPRPVTFCYNGGPGSASVPLNFGGIGPKRVRTQGTAHLGMPAVEDNPHTLLRQSDLVFLDALGTGYSAIAEGVDPATVWGIDGDADAFCRAIIAWLDEHHRWDSPVYLYGESYGTVRNAVLMRLLGEKSVHVTGVVMLSAIFDWVQVQPGADLYYLGMLPTFAATAQFHGRAGAGVDPDTWFDRAMAFTEDVYAPALLKGDRISPREEAACAKKMARLIGLPASLIHEHHLRVDLELFRANLLRDEGRVVGRLDTRFAGWAAGPLQRSKGFLAAEDAASDATDAAWVHALRAFLTDELGYAGAPLYLANNYEKIGTAWNWTHQAPGSADPAQAPNVALDIAVALKRNPTCKLAILGCRYDAATTFWNVRHDIDALFLPPELKGRIEFYRYGSGHMAYVEDETLAQMGTDVAAFYAKA